MLLFSFSKLRVDNFSLLWGELEYGADRAKVILRVDVCQEMIDRLSQETERHCVQSLLRVATSCSRAVGKVGSTGEH